MIAMFLESVFAQWPGQRVMVLTHVKELIEQNYQKLISLWPTAPAGIYSAGLNRRDTQTRIVFGGIGSVAKRADEFGWVDLLIIDEAHLVSPSDDTMYNAFISALTMVNPQLKVIGFTATPYRLGHGRITEGGLFTHLCFDITGMQAFNRLIAEGYICPLIPKHTTTMLDLEGVHMRGGEFIASELQSAVNKDHVTRAALEEAIHLGQDRQSWLIFAAGVEHAIDIADMLTSMGVPCAAVHSKLTATERNTILSDFKCGKYRALTNNNVLTTGFDHPPIDMIVMLRPTASTVLWVQMLGRGTRPYDWTLGWQYIPGFEYTKRNCLVLDFSGNSRRLGPINDPVVPKKKGEKGGDAPVKLCSKCKTWNHASVRFCNGVLDSGEDCNEEFVFTTKLKQGASTEVLIKGDMPVVEVFKVDHVTYARYEKADKPPSVRVSYYCGLRKFDEYICPMHDGWAGRKAREWWKARSEESIPGDTDDALAAVCELPAPTHLRIWVNKKYPEIMLSCFDGSAFGTQEVGAVSQPDKALTGGPVKLPAPEVDFDMFDDDIPF